jgi:hypothetical protein
MPESLVMPVSYAGNRNDTVRAAVFGNDADIGIEFRLVAELREAKSAILGFPFYEDVEMIFFHVDKWTVIPELVNDTHRHKYAELYHRFKMGLGSSGTLIASWPMISPSERNMLQAQGIITVEQLSEVQDSRLAQLPPGTAEMRKKAKQHVQAESGKLDVSKYGDEILDLRRQLADMQARAAAQEEKEAAKEDSKKSVEAAPLPEKKKRVRRTKKQIEEDLKNDKQSDSIN